MNPSYPIFIDICLNKPISSEGIWMRLVMRLPFIPANCQELLLTSDDEDSTLVLELANVQFDVREGRFNADLEDDSMVEQYSAEGTLGETAIIAQYKKFGFVRLNYPQREARA